MLKKQRFAAGSLAALIGAAALLVAPSAHANNPVSNAWDFAYGTSQSGNNAGCALCHGDDSLFPLNPYGTDMQTELETVCGGAIEDCTLENFLEGFANIEPLDSDAPGDLTASSNIAEINANTQPGWAEGDNPAGVTGLLDPAAPAPDIAVSPLAIDFGAVTVDMTKAGTVNIANDGTADLTVGSLTLSGSGEFSLPSAPATPFTVAANTSVNVTVEYAPLNNGLDNGTLDIDSNSPGEELVSVALAGTGIPVVVEECVASVDPAAIDFGSVEIGTIMTLSTTVTNSGGADCTVDAAVSGSLEYSLDSASNFTVAPGTSADVDVDYTPADLGDDAGNLALVFPDRTINVPLSGSGIEAPVEMLNLDIKKFSATKRVSVSKPKAIAPKLSVKNNGLIEGSAPATVTGVQGAAEVYNETINVTDGVGNGSTTYEFPSYIPDTAGDILWTAVIADGDPDDDVATAITTVVQ